MHYFAGLDIGSSATKGVLVDAAGEPVARALLPTGADARKSAEEILRRMLEERRIGPGDAEVYCTGYGRELPAFGRKRPTEIACLALGVHGSCPGVRVAIDVGGQDLKVVALGPDGRHVNFLMNDRCAAGTGRFLEVMARVLEVPLEEIGPLSLKAASSVRITSMCTVFAESEVVSMIARGVGRADILAGVHASVAERIAGQVGRLGVEGETALAGGGALNSGLTAALEARLGKKLAIPGHPQFTIALGAARMARRDARGASTG